MRKCLSVVLVLMALGSVQCGKQLDRYDTRTYPLVPKQVDRLPEEVRAAYSAAHGFYDFRQLLYRPEEPLKGPGQKKFLQANPQFGSVTVRDTVLNQDRLGVFLQSAAGEAVVTESLEPETVYVFRLRLFEQPPDSIQQAYAMSRYTQNMVGQLANKFGLPKKVDVQPEWTAYCRIADAWRGWIDVYCHRETWPAIRSYPKTLPPPALGAGSESLFSSSNAALYYHRAAYLLVEASANSPDELEGVLARLEKAEANPKEMRRLLEPFQNVLQTAVRARSCPRCDLKPLIPQSPGSPVPFPRHALAALARLLAAHSVVLNAENRQEESLEAALAVVKMGWDWNQGPTAYRVLAGEILALGSDRLVRVFSQVRSRTLYNQAVNGLAQYAQGRTPGAFEQFKETVEDYEPDTLLDNETVTEYRHRRIEEAFVRLQVGQVKADIARLIIAAEAFLYDQGEYPDQLEKLVPAYIPQLPVDPFSGALLAYQVTGRYPKIYSWGPDRQDNHGSLRYDPSEGLLSQGDIYYH